MSDLIVARRYAQALYAEAEQTGTVEAVDADVDLIRGTLEASRDLVMLFQSPVVSRAKKESVVKALFADKIQPTTLSFLSLLIDKKREDIFPSIVQAYRDMRDDQLGIAEAQVRTAHALTAEEEQKLRHSLEALTERQVRLNVTVDPDLVGGLIVRVGDTVYDGSVRRQLERMREQLEHGALQLN